MSNDEMNDTDLREDDDTVAELDLAAAREHNSDVDGDENESELNKEDAFSDESEHDDLVVTHSAHSDATQQHAPLLVGIDGGGSHTRVLLTDASGKKLARVEGEGSAIRPGSEIEAAETIAGLIAQALEKAHKSGQRPAVCVVGVAGGGQERAAQALWSALATMRVADDVLVQADATSALDDAFGDSAGVLLISGTGSSAFARAANGNIERCGGWGPAIGDEGSGAWLGRRAFSVITAAQDGREPETALLGALLTATECESPEELIEWAATATPAKFASMVPVISQVATTGDLRANALISFCVEELVLHVRTLSRRCFGDERAAIPVALSGGVLARGTLIRKRLEQRLKSAVPGAMIKSEEVDAARGAVRRAKRLLGVEV